MSKKIKVTIEDLKGTHTYECDGFVGACIDHVNPVANGTDLHFDVLTAGISYLDGCRAATTISASVWDQFIKPLNGNGVLDKDRW